MKKNITVISILLIILLIAIGIGIALGNGKKNISPTALGLNLHSELALNHLSLDHTSLLPAALHGEGLVALHSENASLHLQNASLHTQLHEGLASEEAVLS